MGPRSIFFCRMPYFACIYRYAREPAGRLNLGVIVSKCMLICGSPAEDDLRTVRARQLSGRSLARFTQLSKHPTVAAEQCSHTSWSDWQGRLSFDESQLMGTSNITPWIREAWPDVRQYLSYDGSLHGWCVLWLDSTYITSPYKHHCDSAATKPQAAFCKPTVALPNPSWLDARLHTTTESVSRWGGCSM